MAIRRHQSDGLTSDDGAYARPYIAKKPWEQKGFGLMLLSSMLQKPRSIPA